jgi:membrane protease YdiL (CAAX protease family)
MKRRLAKYLAVSFLWTWGLWLAAYAASARGGYPLYTDATLFDLFGGSLAKADLFTQVLFALGVYGPLIGFLIAAPKRTGTFLGRVRPGQAIYLFIPLAMALSGAVISAIFGFFDGARASLAAVALYFLSNLITSGTEEFGWRGFLYPALREGGQSLWNASWKGGLIWAAWHYPLMFILYVGSGPAAFLSSLAGFTASIVAMAYLTNYVYERTGSIALCMLIHALNNTFNFAVALCFPLSPLGFLPGIAAWGVVAVLDKVDKNRAGAAQGV